MKLIWLNSYVKWKSNYVGYSVQAAPTLNTFSHRSKKCNSCDSFPYPCVSKIIKCNSASSIYCFSFNFVLFCWAASDNIPEVNIKWLYEWIVSSGSSAHVSHVEKRSLCMPKVRGSTVGMGSSSLIWKIY